MSKHDNEQQQKQEQEQALKNKNTAFVYNNRKSYVNVKAESKQE